MGNLKIGTAKVCITPPAEAFPYPGPAYLGGGIEIEGVYLDIYVRMIALSNGEETFLFGCFEESNGTDALKDAVTAKYGIPYQNQMYCQIHNHGGVQTTTVVREGRGQKKHHQFLEVQERMGQMIFERALEAAGEALANMVPAKWGFGTGRSYINVNRDYPIDDGYYSQIDYYDGPSDKTLSVLKFTDENDQVIAAILNYSAHAITTIGAKDVDGKFKVSGDFPGFTCDYLEKEYPGSVVMWTTGAAGDQNAICCFTGEKHYSENCKVSVNEGIPGGYQYAYSQNLGERHAVDADRVLKQIVCHDGLTLRSAYTDVYVPQQEAPAGTNFWLNIAMAQNNVNVVENIAPDMIKDGKIIGRHIDDYLPVDKPEDCEMQLFILGDLAIVTVAAELYVNLGKAIKEACPLKKVFVITVAGGHGNRIGYVQDTDSNTHKTFQHFGEAYPCDSNRIFTDGVKKLVEDIFY
ncbi:MAG: hypothetical protein HDR71_02620 [Lachnospiraceae bacterium]|nr:hypothetical protein [Lachnospiraceae bacterium]